VLRVFKVLLDLKVLKVHKESRVLKEFKEHRESKVLKEQSVQLHFNYQKLVEVLRIFS
jgi:hypothetical protein